MAPIQVILIVFVFATSLHQSKANCGCLTCNTDDFRVTQSPQNCRYNVIYRDDCSYPTYSYGVQIPCGTTPPTYPTRSYNYQVQIPPVLNPVRNSYSYSVQEPIICQPNGPSYLTGLTVSPDRVVLNCPPRASYQNDEPPTSCGIPDNNCCRYKRSLLRPLPQRPLIRPFPILRTLIEFVPNLILHRLGRKYPTVPIYQNYGPPRYYREPQRPISFVEKLHNLNRNGRYKRSVYNPYDDLSNEEDDILIYILNRPFKLLHNLSPNFITNSKKLVRDFSQFIDHLLNTFEQKNRYRRSLESNNIIETQIPQPDFTVDSRIIMLKRLLQEKLDDLQFELLLVCGTDQLKKNNVIIQKECDYFQKQLSYLNAHSAADIESQHLVNQFLNVLWQMNNIERMFGRTLYELSMKNEQNLSTRKELNILFDLSQEWDVLQNEVYKQISLDPNIL